MPTGPNLPPFDKHTCEDVDEQFGDFARHTVKGALSKYPSQASGDYLRRYMGVFHSIVVPSETRDDGASTLGVSLFSL